MRVVLPAERRQKQAQTEQLKPADGQGRQKEKTTITHPETRQVLPLGNSYKYDQLNRLKESKSFSNINISSNTWGNAGSYDNKYYNAFTYDANGNILTQVRHDSVGTKIDELTYRYQKNFAGRLLRNRLYLVNDAVSSSLYGDDIDDMGTFDNNVNTINSANNYSYDGEGRLVKDKQEEIDTIIWRVDGKVSAIRRTSGSLKKNLVFDYDAFGRRTAKHVYTANDELVSSTYYVLDAGGNVMSTYQLDIDDENSSLSMYQNEKYIYGSSRLGMLKDSVNVLGSAYTDTDTTNFSIKLGNKRYELSNHLGNVLSVISDKPIPKVKEQIITENDYSESADIGFNFSSPTTAVIDNGRLKVTTHSIYKSIVKDITTVPGKVYRLRFTADINSQGGISGFAYDQSLSLFLGRVKCYSNGDYVMEFMAKSTTSSIRIETYSNFTRDFYIDNVKIEEVVSPVYANDFSTNYTPFSGYAGTLSIDNGRLKTVVASQWGGVSLNSLSTQPGVKYRVFFFIDLNNEGSTATSKIFSEKGFENSQLFEYESTLILGIKPDAWDFILQKLIVQSNYFIHTF